MGTLYIPTASTPRIATGSFVRLLSAPVRSILPPDATIKPIKASSTVATIARATSPPPRGSRLTTGLRDSDSPSSIPRALKTQCGSLVSNTFVLPFRLVYLSYWRIIRVVQVPVNPGKNTNFEILRPCLLGAHA
jgi:hypothetical protein